MAKPVIWTVDDDPDVLRAVERDLRRHYGDRYKVISADFWVFRPGRATEQLKLRNEPVALFLVDQRMPRMSGVEFLEKAIELYPDAKRSLLGRLRGQAAEQPWAIWTRSRPLARPSRAFTFGRIPFTVSQTAQVCCSVGPLSL